VLLLLVLMVLWALLLLVSDTLYHDLVEVDLCDRGGMPKSKTNIGLRTQGWPQRLYLPSNHCLWMRSAPDPTVKMLANSPSETNNFTPTVLN